MKSLLADVRRGLREEAQPEAAVSAQRFFKQPIRAYGVYTPFLKQLAKEIWPTVSEWSWAQRFAFCDGLWPSGMLEEGILVTHLTEKWAKQSSAAELRVCGEWLGRYVNNWAACDNLCIHWIGPALKKSPSLVSVLDGWEAAESVWLRRASLAGLIHEVRRGRQLPRAKRLVKMLKRDPEEIVRKAVVWMERTLSDAAKREAEQARAAQRRV